MAAPQGNQNAKGRGAPKGNTNAKRAVRRRGIIVNHYIRADVLETLRECVEFETGKSDDEAIRARINSLTDEAIKQETRRVIALYAQSKQQ